MSIPDPLQTLIAAFTFGLLFQAAAAAFFLYFKGHGSTIFKDHRRLVLAVFLILTGLWVLVDFVNFSVPPTRPDVCQVTVSISTTLDQLARITIDGFLLWSVGHEMKSSAEKYILGALMGMRLVAGGIFIAYTRPSYAPVCIAQSNLLPVSVAVVGFDGIIVGVLVVRLFTLRMFEDIREIRPSTKQEQSKALIFCTAALLVWTGTSVTMILDLPSIILLRTAIPAMGLMVLVLIMMIYPSALVLPRFEEISTPEAQSPFVSPSRPLGALDGSNGSPVPSNEYIKRANLFIANTSNTLWDSPTAQFQTDGESENMGYLKYPGVTVPTDISQVVSSGSKDTDLNRVSHAVMQSVIAAASLKPLATHVTLSTPPQLNTAESEQGSSMRNKKWTLFGRSKKPISQNRGRPVISQPILTNTEVNSTTPFARMKTIDLASAAASERERRGSNRELVASRPAPRPPMPEPSIGLKRSISTKRKETPNGTQIAKPPSRSFNKLELPVDANARSTSALLSPGHEEVRRRSPRTSKSFERDIEKSSILESAMRRNTSRFPTGARQQPLNSNAINQQTIMYVNNIVYDNPGVVKSVITGAPAIFAKAKTKREFSQHRSPISPTPSSGSIIHRPRPYRRDSERDRILFPSEPSPSHKRSKSSSSITSRKHSLPSHPGSPTDLLALRPPTSASRLKKLLPNDTRSMTVDEKISLLFPAPPGSLPLYSRRSSVPSLPRIPSGLLHADFFNKDFTKQEPQSQRTSRRSTISVCVRTPVDSKSSSAGKEALGKELDTYRYSADTYLTLTGAPRDSWIPGPNTNILVGETADPDGTQSMNPTEKQKPASSTTETTSDVDGSRDRSTTPWASLYSPGSPIDLAVTRQVAQETYILRKNRELPNLPIDSNNDERSKELNNRSIPFLPSLELGTSTPLAKNQSSFLDSNPAFTENHPSAQQSGQPWHRRIGDEPLTFSERRKNLRSRTMPPPTPLLLSSSSRHATATVREPEPNPIDSPGKVIKEIQAQLERFDVIGQESLDSLFRGTINNKSSNTFDAVAGDQGELLETLEIEMGLQEINWMRLQYNFDRDSNSVIVSPDTRPQAPSSPSSEASSRRTSRSITQGLRIRSNNRAQSQRDGSTSTSSTQSSVNSRASIWQRRLAEAQMEYMDNTPALLGKHNGIFLTLAKAQLGSPTPPDSIDSANESGSDSESDLGNDIYTSKSGEESKPSMIQTLWAPKPPIPKVMVGLLWNPAQYSHPVGTTSPEPAAKSLRPAPRQNLLPLSIVSTKLWSKPEPSRRRRCVGLWGSGMTRPRNIITRPKTQKPPRKSKRMTFLPDIIESPSPLPNKRGTLGIFQFPWGEKSDCPMFDPIPVPAVASIRAGTKFSSSLDARSWQLEPEISEYSSSFFDDYELDPELSSDDDFDETTLWEIASLLNSTDVPSRQSLMPPPGIIENCSDEDDETFDSTPSPVQPAQRPPMTNFIPIQPLKPTSPINSPPRTKSTAGATPVGDIQTAEPIPEWFRAYILNPNYADATGSLATTHSCSINATDLRSALEPNNEGEYIHSLLATTTPPGKGRDVLWTLAALDQTPPITSWLVGARDLELVNHIGSRTALTPHRANAFPKKINPSNLWNKPTRAVSSQISDEHYNLWRPQGERLVVEPIGLSTIGIHQTGFRTSGKSPAALEMTRRPRLTAATLAPLNSQSLWSPKKEQFIDRHWTLESSVRPSNPSVSSRSPPFASGRSPSDPDDHTITSASSKVSPIRTPLTTLAKEVAKVPSWPESKRVKDGPPSPHEARTKRGLPEPSKRASAVLVARDLWETEAGVLNSNSQEIPSPDNIIPETFQQQKSKPKARNAATPSRWTAALVEAVSPGGARIQRPSATPAEWDAALIHVLSQSPSHDLTIPPLVSSALFVHPAANGHVAHSRPLTEQDNENRLWAKPLCSSAALMKVPLWTAHRAAKSHNSSLLTYHAPSMVRKPLAKSRTSLPKLSSDAIWSMNASSLPEIHWLHTTSIETKLAGKLQIQTPEPSSPILIRESPQPLIWMSTTNTTSNSTSPIRSGALWTPPAAESANSKANTQNLFGNPHNLPWKRPTSSSSSSTTTREGTRTVGELWRPRWRLPESPKNWLKNQRATRVEFRY